MKNTLKDGVEEITVGSTNQGFSVKVPSILPPHTKPHLLLYERAMRRVPVSYLIISLMKEENGI